MSSLYNPTKWKYTAAISCVKLRFSLASYNLYGREKAISSTENYSKSLKVVLTVTASFSCTTQAIIG